MFEFAQFVAVTDDAIRVHGSGQDARKALPPFDLIHLNKRRKVVLQFKMSGAGFLSPMRMQLNGGPYVIDYQIPDREFFTPRSWHEVIDGDLFEERNNELVIEVSSIHVGSMMFSDVIVTYHAAIETSPVLRT